MEMICFYLQSESKPMLQYSVRLTVEMASIIAQKWQVEEYLVKVFESILEDPEIAEYNSLATKRDWDLVTYIFSVDSIAFAERISDIELLEKIIEPGFRGVNIAKSCLEGSAFLTMLEYMDSGKIVSYRNSIEFSYDGKLPVGFAYHGKNNFQCLEKYRSYEQFSMNPSLDYIYTMFKQDQPLVLGESLFKFMEMSDDFIHDILEDRRYIKKESKAFMDSGVKFVVKGKEVTAWLGGSLMGISNVNGLILITAWGRLRYVAFGDVPVKYVATLFKACVAARFKVDPANIDDKGLELMIQNTLFPIDRLGNNVRSYI